MKFNDLTGKKFGKSIVINRLPNKRDSSGRSRTLWNCRCECGSEFNTTSCGCKKQSFGEHYIKTLLENIEAEFIPQYTFDDCKYKYVLHFDFAIFYTKKLIGLIEYDGRQHFEPVEIFGGDEGFKETIKRDEIKNDYCKTHNIPLLRIPYTLTFDEIKKQIYEYYLSLTTAGRT